MTGGLDCHAALVSHTGGTHQRWQRWQRWQTFQGPGKWDSLPRWPSPAPKGYGRPAERAPSRGYPARRAGRGETDDRCVSGITHFQRMLEKRRERALLRAAAMGTPASAAGGITVGDAISLIGYRLICHYTVSQVGVPAPPPLGRLRPTRANRDYPSPSSGLVTSITVTAPAATANLTSRPVTSSMRTCGCASSVVIGTAGRSTGASCSVSNRIGSVSRSP